MIEKHRSFEEELKALERERILKENITNSHKNKLISEIQNAEINTLLTLKKRKKTFLQKLLSVFR